MKFKGKLFAAAGLKHDNFKAYLAKSNFRQISEVFIHPKFNDSNWPSTANKTRLWRPARGVALRHDLAILRVNESFRLGAGDIYPGCLFEREKNEFEKSDLIAAGFGDTTRMDPRPPNRMIQAYPLSIARLKQTSECAASLGNFDNETSLCAISNFSEIKPGDRGTSFVDLTSTNANQRRLANILLFQAVLCSTTVQRSCSSWPF